MRALLSLAFVTVAAQPQAPAQEAKRSADAPAEVDPYTKLDPARVKSAGYVSLGRPLRLTSELRSRTIEEALGTEWMLWAETEHFKLGAALAERTAPRGDRAANKRLEGELDRLRDRGLDLPRHVRKLDPWLTIHLFAQQLEELYEEVERMAGVTDQTFPPPSSEPPDLPVNRSTMGPYLGAHGKFVVLLFEHQADLARYLSGFAGLQRDISYRYYLAEEDVSIFATSREPYSVSGHEHSWFRCHVAGNLVRTLVLAFRGYRYSLPLWISEGLAHHTTREMDRTYFSPTVAAGQEADSRRDTEWEDKVYARVKNDYYPPSAELMTKDDPREFLFADHLMAWSRVDFLLSRSDARPGEYLNHVKSLPWRVDLTFADVCAIQEEALRKGWGLDYASLDEEWVRWVRKAYHPKRKRDP